MITKGYKMPTAKVRSIKSAIKQELVPVEPFIIPEIELSYTSYVKPKDRLVINGVDDTYKLLHQTWDKNKIELQEQFKVLLLNRANQVLGIYEMSTGGANSTIAETRLILAAAIKANASGIVTAHNHPSGSLKPSGVDKAITKRIKEAAWLFDIMLLDSLIISPFGYYSFAQEGMI